MLRFYAKPFLEALNELDGLAKEEPSEKRTPEQLARIIASRLKDIGQRVGSQLGLDSLEKSAIETDRQAKAGGLTLDAARYAAQHFRGLLLAELEAITFLIVEGRDRQLFENPRRLSGSAASAFPASDEELAEGGRCLALGRDTAAVLHAMRALEAPLDSLCKRVGLPEIPRPWGVVLERIEKEIPKSKLAKKEREDLARAAVEFRWFKDAWRNHAMHARQNYNRERAERVLEHVASFVEQLVLVVAGAP